MPQISNINTGGLATSAEAIAGTNQRVLLSPSTLKEMTDIRISNGIVRNMGMRLDAGNLVLCAADGTDLSPSNPAKLLMSFNSQFNELTVTANVTLTAANMSGSLFNTRNLVAWNEDHPFYVYCFGYLGAFGISAQYLKTTIGTFVTSPGAADAQGTSYVFSGSTNTNTPLCLGSFRARKDALNVWTIQALDQTDGIGQFKEKIWYNMPLGQYIANSYLVNATAPIFSSQSMQYCQDGTGNVRVRWDMSGDGGTDGSGTNGFELGLPFVCNTAGSLNRRGGSAQAYFAGTTRTNCVCDFETSSTSPTMQFFRVDTTTKLLVGAFTAGDRYFSGSVTYLMQGVSLQP